MKRIHLAFFIIAAFLEGLAALLFLWQMQFDPGRGQIVNYGALRLVLTVFSGVALLCLAAALLALFRWPNTARKVCHFLDGWLVGLKPPLFFIQGALLLLTVFLVESFLLTYLAVPVPLRPLLAWAACLSFQTWLALRLAYASEYRQRASPVARLREAWRNWLPVQRKTLILLSLMGLVYFLAFMPGNYRLDGEGHFYTHSDEAVIYPDVARVLVDQGSFYDQVKVVMEDWPWWYGYPYLTLSAGVLLVPRLIFGNGYAGDIQLNIFLLRQFINILPMILALMLLVYLVDRFRYLWRSILLFIFMALVPGVVKFNYQFWHPDSLIILLLLLTFYFLEKDELRFGRFFYYAAVTCGLAAAIKLWGFFFVLAIAGYLLAGLWKKKLTIKKAVLSALGFLLAMAGTIVLTSPSLLAPYIRNSALEGWAKQQESLLHGYNEPDPTGVYETGLVNSLRFFGFFFMKPFFLGFALFSLAVGSIYGSRQTMNRLILAWSAPTAFFLINFAAMKNFVYLMPLMLPLFLGAALFPTLAGENSAGPAFLRKPLIKKILFGITALVFLLQLGINGSILLTSPMMGY